MKGNSSPRMFVDPTCEEGHSHDSPFPDDPRSPLHQAAAEVLWAITLFEHTTAIDHLRAAYEAGQ